MRVICSFPSDETLNISPRLVFVKSQCFTYFLVTEGGRCTLRTDLYNTETKFRHFIKILLLTKSLQSVSVHCTNLDLKSKVKGFWVGSYYYYVVVSEEGYFPPLLECTYKRTNPSSNPCSQNECVLSGEPQCCIAMHTLINNELLK